MSSSKTTPDLVIVNADVWTMEDGRAGSARPPRALAVSGGRIVAVGEDDEVRSLGDKGSEVIDAQGRTVLPGMTDGHTHFQCAAIQRHLYVDYSLSRPRTIEAVLDEIKDRAVTTERGAWIRGDGLLHLDLAERRYPTRHELDRAAPEHPVVIVGRGHHAVAANSHALRIAGITKETQDPPGGEIGRDENGELNGVLVERGKLRLDPYHAETVVPNCGWEDRLESLRLAIQHAHSFGVTGIHDIIADPLEVTSYLELKRTASLDFRISVLIRGVGTETMIPLEYICGLGLRQGFGDAWLGFGGVKMSIDGSHSQSAAAVYEPYPGDPDNIGQIRIAQEELDAAIATCHQRGIRAAVHAVGQRAVDMTCDAFEKAYASPAPLPTSDIRHRVEHAFLPPNDGQLKRLRSLDLTVSTQPALVLDVNSYIKVFGEQIVNGLLPLRAMLDEGLRLVFGTDYPGVPINPFPGIGFAVTRRSAEGVLVDQSQAISLHDAVAMYTRAPAYATNEENEKGTLGVGKLADLIVLDRTLNDTVPEEIAEVQVESTLVNGRVVYQRS